MDVNSIEDSILPMIIESKDGNIEKIYCCSISGGKNYVNNMPKKLELCRIDANNNKFIVEYVINQKATIQFF